jgi:hypothetical protein
MSVSRNQIDERRDPSSASIRVPSNAYLFQPLIGGCGFAGALIHSPMNRSFRGFFANSSAEVVATHDTQRKW